MVHATFVPLTFLDEISATMGTNTTVWKELPGHAYPLLLPIFAQ